MNKQKLARVFVVALGLHLGMLGLIRMSRIATPRSATQMEPTQSTGVHWREETILIDYDDGTALLVYSSRHDGEWACGTKRLGRANSTLGVQQVFMYYDRSGELVRINDWRLVDLNSDADGNPEAVDLGTDGERLYDRDSDHQCLLNPMTNEWEWLSAGRHVASRHTLTPLKRRTGGAVSAHPDVKTA